MLLCLPQADYCSWIRLNKETWAFVLNEYIMLLSVISSFHLNDYGVALKRKIVASCSPTAPFVLHIIRKKSIAAHRKHLVRLLNVAECVGNRPMAFVLLWIILALHRQRLIYCMEASYSPNRFFDVFCFMVKIESFSLSLQNHFMFFFTSISEIRRKTARFFPLNSVFCCHVHFISCI